MTFSACSEQNPKHTRLLPSVDMEEQPATVNRTRRVYFTSAQRGTGWQQPTP
jgi:hypothetical protein